MRPWMVCRDLQIPPKLRSTVTAEDREMIKALSAAVKDVARRAGEGRLQQRELEGGSLTVSNLGMFGVDEFAAILNPQHGTILAIGSAKPRPWVGDDVQLTVATTCRIA